MSHSPISQRIGQLLKTIPHYIWLASVPFYLAGLLLVPRPVSALPSYARQTDLPCVMCHTSYPQLTEFGRRFKLLGYTMGNADIPFYKHLAAMAMPSFTHTEADQADDAAPGFANNDNFALTQASIFYGGKIAGDLGAFVQVTYDGVAKQWSLDNTDIRFARQDELRGKPLIWGIDVNNNPTVQDLWNSTPAWQFPGIGSGLAPTPSAATLIEGGLAGQVGSIGAYGYWNDTVYAELSLYRTLGADLQKALGVDPEGEYQIDGVAPYWRLALEHDFGKYDVSIGTFGLDARVYPGRDRSAGSDHLTDLGLDLQYQAAFGNDNLDVRVAWIHEMQSLDASNSLGGASDTSNHLNSMFANASYLWDKTLGFTVGYNSLRGSADTLYYDTTDGAPDSDWFTFELDWLPYNKVGGPSGFPTFNPKLSAQYVVYDRFDGVSANASDNNTLYLQLWLLF